MTKSPPLRQMHQEDQSLLRRCRLTRRTGPGEKPPWASSYLLPSSRAGCQEPFEPVPPARFRFRLSHPAARRIQGRISDQPLSAFRSSNNIATRTPDSSLLVKSIGNWAHATEDVLMRNRDRQETT